MTTEQTTWLEARRRWVRHHDAAETYRFACVGCGHPVVAGADEMGAYALAGGLCTTCTAAEQAMYRRATSDDFLRAPRDDETSGQRE